MEIFTHQAIHIWWLWSRHNFTIQKKTQKTKRLIHIPTIHNQQQHSLQWHKRVKQRVGSKCLRLLMLSVVWKLWNIRTKLLSSSSNIKQHFYWIVQCLDFGDVLSYSSLQLHLTLSVVCYCDVVLRSLVGNLHTSNMKKISWNKAHQQEAKLWRNSTTRH